MSPAFEALLAEVGDEDLAVDLRRISRGAADRLHLVGLVDQDIQGLADLALHALLADDALGFHEAVPAVMLLILIDLFEAEIIGFGAVHGLVFEAAHAVEFRFLQPIQHVIEIGLGLAGEADDEGRADGEVGADFAPLLDPLQHLVLIARTLHRLQDLRARMLEGDVEIGKDQAIRHQRDDVVDMRIGIDVVEARPGAQLSPTRGRGRGTSP